MRKLLGLIAGLTAILLIAGSARASLLNPADWKLPDSWTSPVFHPSQWPFSLFPVPEVATDPNQGTTFGILPVFLFSDEHHEIRQIIAPDIAINTILGASGNFRYLA